jgi:hypothetical protein
MSAAAVYPVGLSSAGTSTDSQSTEGSQSSARLGFLHSIRFRLSSASAIEELPDCALLFSESDQQIDILNDTSVVLARRMIDGASADELSRELVSLGADAAEAPGWVMNFLAALSRRSILEVVDAGQSATSIEKRIRAAGMNFSLNFSSPELERLISPPFEHLATDADAVGLSYTLSGGGEAVLITRDDGRAVLVSSERSAVQLKGMVLEDVLETADYLCALHAACLVRDGAAILLLGPPGTGKTTFLLKLLSEGYSYMSDDVTLVHAGGEVAGLPLAPGIKEGSWTLASVQRLGVEKLPIHLRPDGVRVRFLPMNDGPSPKPIPVSTIIRLQRSVRGSPQLTSLSPSEAVAELLREARSTTGECSVEIFQAIMDLVRNARAFELRYSESDEAFPLVDEQVVCVGLNPHSDRF